MNRLFFAGLLLLLCSAAKAQPAGYVRVKDIATFKNQFAAASQKISSIKADFEQEKNLSMLSDKIISKGKFWFKKENKVRMEYAQPFQYLMILNNNNIYIKDGQKENKISAGSNKLFQQVNKIVVDCVRGTAFSNTDFKVNVFESKTAYLIELVPAVKNLQQIFKTINVITDKNDYSVNTIVLNEASGDNTTIHFITKEINTNLPDALFAH
ncbi:outer membrane lipoprotein carrier protein LolA [Parafilimonas sp.]|uniref:outer membrane lipoprotein carrier protein LolA n=1 Tax=Parafilimonas sp. TaxID=1969739 RepID=UPI0039E4B161